MYPVFSFKYDIHEVSPLHHFDNSVMHTRLVVLHGMSSITFSHIVVILNKETLS